MLVWSLAAARPMKATEGVPSLLLMSWVPGWSAGKSEVRGKGIAGSSYSYGYGPGDHYRFMETIRETLDTEQDHLVWESSSLVEVWIEKVEENVGAFAIKITARVARLSGDGLEGYSERTRIEGYTPVVAGPSSYFTHTDWAAHLEDWAQDAQNWQDATQMSGTVEQDLDRRYFHWDLSRQVDNATSTIDVDLDGQTDSYRATHQYTAQFDERGVVLLREWYDGMDFDCGAQYTRRRTITQIPTTPISPLLPLVALLIAASLVGAGALLAVLALRLAGISRSRRRVSPGEER